MKLKYGFFFTASGFTFNLNSNLALKLLIKETSYEILPFLASGFRKTEKFIKLLIRFSIMKSFNVFMACFELAHFLCDFSHHPE